MVQKMQELKNKAWAAMRKAKDEAMLWARMIEIVEKLNHSPDRNRIQAEKIARAREAERLRKEEVGRLRELERELREEELKQPGKPEIHRSTDRNNELSRIRRRKRKIRKITTSQHIGYYLFCLEPDGKITDRVVKEWPLDTETCEIDAYDKTVAFMNNLDAGIVWKQGTIGIHTDGTSGKGNEREKEKKEQQKPNGIPDETSGKGNERGEEEKEYQQPNAIEDYIDLSGADDVKTKHEEVDLEFGNENDDTDEGEGNQSEEEETVSQEQGTVVGYSPNTNVNRNVSNDERQGYSSSSGLPSSSSRLERNTPMNGSIKTKKKKKRRRKEDSDEENEGELEGKGKTQERKQRRAMPPGRGGVDMQ